MRYARAGVQDGFDASHALNVSCTLMERYGLRCVNIWTGVFRLNRFQPNSNVPIRTSLP